MRTRFSPILICGAATLFAACESSSTTTGGGDASRSDASSSDTADGSSDGIDGGLEDTSIGEDVSDDDVYAGEDTDTPDDVPVIAEDVPGRTDIEFPMDVDQDTTSDIESPDITQLDVHDTDTGGPDVDPGDVDPGDVDPGDVDPGDVDPGDVDPGDVDPGDVDDDVQTPEGPQIGEPCDGSIQSWCSDEAVPTLSCEYIEAKWTWTEYDDTGLPCFCDPMSSPGPAVCAVPGFVGIDQSGRERRAPSLRALRRAARLA